MITHIVLYFLVGFWTYHWELKARIMDLTLFAYMLALFVGGIYFAEGWAIVTILLSFMTAPLFLMGLINKIFGRKKSIVEIIVDTQSNIFKTYEITKPTDAQKMKAFAYISIAGTAICKDIGGRMLSHAAQKMIEDTSELTKSLSMRVGELSNDKEELEELLSYFFTHHQRQINDSAVINGMEGFEALYCTKVEKLVADILRYNSGSLGATGGAAIVVADGIFGKGMSEKHSWEVSMHLHNFRKELIEAI